MHTTIDIMGMYLDPREVRDRVEVLRTQVSQEEANEISLSLLSGSPDDAEITSGAGEELLFLEHFIDQIDRRTFEAACDQGVIFVAADLIKDYAKEFISDIYGIEWNDSLWNYIDLKAFGDALQQDMELVETDDREWLIRW